MAGSNVSLMGQNECCCARKLKAKGENLVNKTTWSRLLLSTVIAGGMLFSFAGNARADRDRKQECKSRLELDRARIDRDASRHGEHSRQVNNDVAKMDRTRQWCKEHQSDWDHDRFDIGVYFHK
jgi:hypothetical protein